LAGSALAEALLVMTGSALAEALLVSWKGVVGSLMPPQAYQSCTGASRVKVGLVADAYIVFPLILELGCDSHCKELAGYMQDVFVGCLDPPSV